MCWFTTSWLLPDEIRNCLGTWRARRDGRMRQTFLLLDGTLESFPVKIWISGHLWRSGRDQRKWQPCQVCDMLNKQGNYIEACLWAAAVLSTPCSLKATCPWKWLPLWEQWTEVLSQGPEQVKSLQLPTASSQVNRQSCPPAHLLLHHGTQYKSQKKGGTQEGHSLTSCTSTVWSPLTLLCGISSVQLCCSVLSHSLQPHGLQHIWTPCPSPTPGDCSDSCPLSRWYHPTISSSVILFSSWLQSFSASGSFPVSQFFASYGQSIGASASASVPPMNIQDWFPLRLTGLISLESKGLKSLLQHLTSKASILQCSALWFNFHVYTWLLEKP